MNGNPTLGKSSEALEDQNTLSLTSWSGSLDTYSSIGFDGGDDNLYRYVGDDPSNATDPTGLCAGHQIGNPLPKKNSTAAEWRFTYTLSETTNLTDAQLNYLNAMKAALIDSIIQAIVENDRLTKQDIATLRQLARYLHKMKIGMPVMIGDGPPAALDFLTNTVYISTTIIKTYKRDLDRDGTPDSICNPKGVAIVLIHESIHISKYMHKKNPDPLLTDIAIDVFNILEDTHAWQEFLKSQGDNPFPF